MVNELLVKKIQTAGVCIELEEIKDAEIHDRSAWVGIASWVNLAVKDDFIIKHYSPQTVAYADFIEQFKSLAVMFKGDGKAKEPWVDYAPLSVWFMAKDKSNLRFLITSGTIDKIILALESAFQIISDYNKRKSTLIKSALKVVFVQPDNIKYLRFISEKWEVINPLFEASEGVSKRYLEKNDYRIKKPWIVFQKENLHRYKITSNNWVLEFDKLETLMLQPNDVSIYSSISDHNLDLAYSFYKETILPRHKSYHGSFPVLEQQQEYFNYFQLIITSIIFAYTALEAFANICIPDNYTIEEEKQGIKTIYSKTGIERTFSLRDKFKRVLSDVLQTSEPSQEKWWSKFIALEKLRNEIIHTKQSDTAERYSTLLSKSIFELIKVHKIVIGYYGHYINLNKPGLLDEFPYKFGYDNVVAGVTESPEYRQWIKDNKMHMAFLKASKQTSGK